jgi:hypothetical protein
MSSGFKPKNAKIIKVDKKYVSSVDTKHHEMMSKIVESTSKQIPTLKLKLKQLKNKQTELSNLLNNTTPNLEILDEFIFVNEQIKENELKIKELKENERNYLLEHSKTLFEYYETRQDQNENITQKKILSSFFKQEDDTPSLPENQTTYDYLSKMDDHFIDLNKYSIQPDVCEKCGNETISIHTEGILLCRTCGLQHDEITENEAPSYKDPPKEISSYAYKRKNHFKEILAQFQGKETTDIKPIVLDNIKKQIKKERIEMDDITNDKMKNILKKLGYNKYYEHITFIKSHLGIKPPIMSEELEEKLCNMFDEIQTPYSKFCPPDRVNFLNYYGVLYKMCELLGEDEYLPHFYMLKDRIKRMEQDEIWKKICDELNWEFIPST